MLCYVFGAIRCGWVRVHCVRSTFIGSEHVFFSPHICVWSTIDILQLWLNIVNLMGGWERVRKEKNGELFTYLDIMRNKGKRWIFLHLLFSPNLTTFDEKPQPFFFFSPFDNARKGPDWIRYQNVLVLEYGTWRASIISEEYGKFKSLNFKDCVLYESGHLVFIWLEDGLFLYWCLHAC